jgi:hypothetical protein
MRLKKYLGKFHSFLKVENETLQSWHSRSLPIFHQNNNEKLPQLSIMTLDSLFRILWRLFDNTILLLNPAHKKLLT